MIPTFASLHAQHLRTGRPKLRSYGAPVSYGGYGGYGGATYGASYGGYGGYGGASYARPATYSAAAPVGTVSPLPA